ncbi:subtilisin-like protein [Gonapodya prolifera JEL478]|uniref:tripeptidyl-peptidase II n=1 Tax=Gonapodya prolifera (strain JEL478) TaxID=1344416 RepID=A0A139AC35_GONPJ|nr:subtilisin-like protein [Gonapodya prolifera JEL478]|eukprot:KXS13983.1 subtilisin-like protein [Gonapodya prolifera JEL478]
MGDSKPAISTFPLDGLLPKEETQAAAFIQKNPTFDGRGTIIAILDTGVDPAAPGLTLTSHGNPKIIDVVDCSGSGDVVMRAPVTPAAGGPPTLVSTATSRKLLLDPSWVIDGATFRLGAKAASDLFPKPVLDRVQKARKRAWEVAQGNVLAAAVGDLDKFGNGGGAGTTADDDGGEEKDKWKQELKARVDVLKDMGKNYADPGDIYDVLLVTPPSGSPFVVVDTSLTGDLRKAIPLTDYAESRAWSKFGDFDLLTYSIKIFDGGDRVSIVTLAGSHGTHVASISSSHHAAVPTTSGVAPGSQLVSLKIGDTRLGSMETGLALSRAATYLAKTHPFGKVHVSNMSYGEGSSSVKGCFGDRVTEWVVNRAGGVFVSSAGNAGPGVGTVGAPGGMASGMIGVGAYVTSSLQSPSYSLIEPVPERPYTWSSRGPAFDGWQGVSVYAPGGAVAEVPRYSLAPTQLMNGTSMASPNAAGCVSLLISALLSSNMPYSPYTIRRALENTGKDIADPQGVTFVQVQRAWEWLVESRKRNGGGRWDVEYEVTFPELPLSPRGIYLRESISTGRILQTSCDVRPKFPNEENGDQERKLALEVQLELSTTAAWVQAPKNVLLNHGGKTFNIRVDPSGLAPGLHCAFVLAHDTSSPDLGPLFRVPITICKPHPPSVDNRYQWPAMNFGPGHVERLFVEPPQGANFAILTVKSVGRDTMARFTVQIIQVLPQTRYAKTEQEYTIALSSTSSDSPTDLQTVRMAFRVIPGVVMEICLAQFWSQAGASTVSVEVEFHGIQVTGSLAGSGNSAGSVGGSGLGASGLYLNGGDGFGSLEVFAPLRKESFAFGVSFDIIRRVYRPTEYHISPLASRDVLPNGSQASSLTLTYEFKLFDSTTVTPRLPFITNQLYESPFEGFLLLIYDSGKKVVGTQDIYPKSLKLDRGEYTIRCQIVAASTETLERHSSATLVLDCKMGKDLSLPVYPTAQDALIGGKSGYGSKVLQLGERRAIFWTAVDAPKETNPGDLLVGELKCYGGSASGNGVDKIDGGLGSVSYLVPPAKNKESENDNKSRAKDKRPDEATQLAEGIRDLEIGALKKLPDDKRSEVMTRLEAQFPDFLPLLQAKLDVYSTAALTRVAETCTELLEQCDKLIAVANGTAKSGQNELALYYAGKPDTSSASAKELKKEMEKRKDAVVFALLVKLKVYSELASQVKASVSESSGDANTKLKEAVNALDAAYAEYSKWASAGGTSDATPEKDENLLRIYVRRERLAGRFGNALKAINKFLSDPPVGELTRSGNTSTGTLAQVYTLRTEVLRDLGWDVWVEYDKSWRAIKWPAEFALIN